MKDLGLLACSIGMFLCGVMVAADENAELLRALAADNASLRATSETLRRQCPTRPRYQRGPLIKGQAV